MENLNEEQVINELDCQTRFAKFSNSNRVLISVKCAQFVLDHVQYYEQRIKDLETENKQFGDEQRKLIAERDAYKTWAYNKNALINAMTDKIEMGYEPYDAKAVAEAEMWQRIALREKELTEEVASWKAIAEGYQKQFEDCAEDRARLSEENESWQKSLITEKENADKAYYELACEVENLRAENERLRSEKEAAIEDLEHCMYFSKPKKPNTCNFCTHDCEVSKDGTRCKGKEDWIYCSPVWRGFVKPKAEGGLKNA